MTFFAAKTDEMRFYPKGEMLDNRHIAATRTYKRPIMFINVFEDYLLAFTAERKAQTYILRDDKGGKLIVIE